MVFKEKEKQLFSMFMYGIHVAQRGDGHREQHYINSVKKAFNIDDNTFYQGQIMIIEEDESKSTAFFSEALRDMSQEKKDLIIDTLWRITLIDGICTENEKKYLKMFGNILGLNVPYMINFFEQNEKNAMTEMGINPR